MKKKIIYSSVLATLLGASSIALAGGPEIIPEPDYFSGIYIGGIGGVHHNTFNGSSSVVSTEPLFEVPFMLTIGEEGLVNTTDLGGGEFDGYGGVQGGIGKVLNHQFYVGLQGFGEWGSSSESSTQSQQRATASGVTAGILENFITVTLANSATLNASSTTTMKISNDYGLAGKFGWIVAPRSMIYGKVGASWANVKVTNSTYTSVASDNLGLTLSVNTEPPIIITGPGIVANGDFSSYASSGDQTKLGLLLGIGFEQFVYQDVVSLNVEYNYTNYGTVTTGPGRVTGTVSSDILNPGGPLATFPVDTDFYSQASAHVTVSSLMAGLNFYFGRDWF